MQYFCCPSVKNTFADSGFVNLNFLHHILCSMVLLDSPDRVLELGPACLCFSRAELLEGGLQAVFIPSGTQPERRKERQSV